MKRQYIRSERAHFMCPNMHFGIAFQLAVEYDAQRFQLGLQALAAAHPFLNCIIVQEESGALYYADTGSSTIDVTIRDGEAEFREDYRRLGERAWDVFHNGLLKVFCYPQREAGCQILFVAHHLLCDGRGLLQLVTEFADYYAEDKNPTRVEEQLITSASDLPEKSSLSGISRLLVQRMNRLWCKERQMLSYAQFTAFSEQFAKDNPCGYLWGSLSEKRLLEIEAFCHKAQVSVNDYLLAVLFSTADTEKIVIGADVRSEIACYRSGAMGNYSSAIGIVYKNRKAEFTEKAREIHCLIEKYRQDKRKWLLVLACYLEMEPGLVDAAAIASLGNFKSRPAKFVGSAMFGFHPGTGVSLTNLGSVENKNILSAVFIPPLSPSAKEVIGVLTMNGRMEVTGSFYRKKISEEELQRQLHELTM